MSDPKVAAARGPSAWCSRLPMRYIGPSALFLTTAVLLGWSSIETLRPVPQVEVVQVLALVQDTGSAELRTDEPSARDTERGGAQIMVQAPGWIEADPYSVAAAALADGVVAEILALEGERVSAGQIVARLVAEDAELDLRAAEAQVHSLEAEVSLAQARLDAARTTWDEAVEVTREVETARSDLLELDARLVQLPSLIQKEMADLEGKRQEMQRTEKAADSGSASEIELVLARAAVDAQMATVESLQRQKEILEAQRTRATAELHAAERNYELRTADRLRLDSASSELRAAQARLARATASRDSAALRVRRMEIRSPIDGLVQRRFKSPGDKVMLGMDDPRSSQILRIYDPEKLQVRADVPLSDASQIRIGQRCEIVSEILPDRVFTGEVTRITNEADLQRNTLQVKVRIIDPSPMLRPEMLARVRFLPSSGGQENEDARSTRDSGLRIPTEAVRERAGSDASVLAVRQRRGLRGNLERIAVRLENEPDETGWVVVRGELFPTDLVVMGATPANHGATVSYIAHDRNRTGREQ